ncbi:MAG: helix-turn-helix domain-containing protein [Flavobacteriales bacterium]
MYTKKSLDSDLLLRWCKLLDYNFFMFYHSHLQMYKPSASVAKLKNIQISNDERQDYVFRKNLYMPEIIDWLLSKLDENELTVKEIIEIYNIPKTTIYRWKKKRD